MKNFEKWLSDQGYNYKKVTFYNVEGTGANNPGYMVDTGYFGPYPGAAQFEILNTIRVHVKRYYKNLRVEARGYYSGVAIY
jgi:hypothetical protein